MAFQAMILSKRIILEEAKVISKKYREVGLPAFICIPAYSEYFHPSLNHNSNLEFIFQ